MTRGDFAVLAAWWREGSVKAAAESLGIAEQTAKNDLASLRRICNCRTNDQLLEVNLRRVINERNSILTPKEKRKLRYDYDAEYRERAKRQARNAMRRKRALDQATSQTEYDRLLALQGDRCAICGSPEGRIQYGVRRRLSVDHDHATGNIRELLCTGCNYMLGCAKDSPELLETAAAYLRKHAKPTSHNVSRVEAEHESHAA